MKIVPGTAFSISRDCGHTIGLFTHEDAAFGELVWMASGHLDVQPTLRDALDVIRWRWCVFFPLRAAIRRRLVERLGTVEIPDDLRELPTLRVGSRAQGWYLKQSDGSLPFAWPTSDMSIPPEILVNDTRLKEMLVAGWMPADFV